MVPKCKCGDGGILAILKRLVSAFFKWKGQCSGVNNERKLYVELAEKYIKNEPSTHDIIKKKKFVKLLISPKL